MCVLQLGVIDCCVLEHVVFFRKGSSSEEAELQQEIKKKRKKKIFPGMPRILVSNYDIHDAHAHVLTHILSGPSTFITAEEGRKNEANWKHFKMLISNIQSKDISSKLTIVSLRGSKSTFYSSKKLALANLAFSVHRAHSREFYHSSSAMPLVIIAGLGWVVTLRLAPFFRWLPMLEWNIWLISS